MKKKPIIDITNEEALLHSIEESCETGRATRRDLLRAASASILAAGMLPLAKIAGFAAQDASKKEPLQPRKKRDISLPADLAVAKGENPARLTRKAVEALGGMSKFVRRGDIVVIKPNIGWAHGPLYAVNTNPFVVAELVRMCREAGAKRVKVFDNTCCNPRICYKNSGVEVEAKKAGAEVSHIADWKFAPSAFPAGSAMEKWPLYSDAIKCDCFINVPVAKHHRLTHVTLAMKNLMGICGGNRGVIHQNIDQKLPELMRFTVPELTVIDAFRILVDHGPSGGKLADVKFTKTVIAGNDPVLCDAYGATLFGHKPRDIAHIKKAEEMQVGSADIGRARVREIKA